MVGCVCVIFLHGPAHLRTEVLYTDSVAVVNSSRAYGCCRYYKKNRPAIVRTTARHTTGTKQNAITCA